MSPPATPRRIDPRTVALGLVGLPLGAIAYAAAIGLGLHRHGTPWAVSAGATSMVFLPPLMAALAAHRRTRAFFAALVVWALAGLLVLPVYFPGERRDAVSSGLAVLMGSAGWSELAEQVADSLPEEPDLAAPELAQATEVVRAPPPPTRDVLDHEIVLPYEGEGRNLAIPVVFEHRGVEVEVMMMLDTGATYTTLPEDVLAELGLYEQSDDPVLRLHTANGERDAHILGMEHVWLGDLRLDHVAIATCNPCRSKETVGLLGLNVAGGFNVTIDADRREVTFTRRDNHDRKLDAKPWIDLDARFSRFPGGRVEVEVDVSNGNDKDLAGISAQVRCGELRWTIDLGGLPAGGENTVRRKLPRHESCEAYEISLHEVSFD